MDVRVTPGRRHAGESANASTGVRRLRAPATAAVLALLMWAAAPAGAQIQGDPDSQRLVTIAARECDSYTDIRANLARNDIQESLQDLGADTLYTSGQPVDPRTELAGQPKCRPITGWQFTFGDGIAVRTLRHPGVRRGTPQYPGPRRPGQAGG